MLPTALKIYNHILNRLKKDDKCNIFYEDLLSFLDFQTRPVFTLTEDEYAKIVRHAPPVKDTEVRLHYILPPAYRYPP